VIRQDAQERLETNLTCAGMVVRVFDRDGGAVIDVAGANGRGLTPADVVDVRSQIAQAGYEEVRAWVATEGMSWLSDGQKSLSFQVREVSHG
jgi:hypothetical protein